MHWLEAKITFSGDNEALIVDLITVVFDDLGVKGVVVDDPHLEPAEGWGSDAAGRPEQPAVTGYLPADERIEQRRLDLEQTLAHLAAQQTFGYDIHYQRVDEEDWAESWKAFFEPQEITPRLVVKPTWRDYDPQPGQAIIEIDPGMAFGTGNHPTTVLCIELLEKYIRPGHTILDVGTGSGILLIAAARLSASSLTGVDRDPLAVTVARRNLLQNQISTDQFDLLCGDLIKPVGRPHDVVVANILAEVIVDLLDSLPPALAPNGIFICSGIIRDRQAEVVAKLSACGFQPLETRIREEWVAIAASRKEGTL